MAITNLQELVDSQQMQVERKVLRYDVSWGKPFGGMDYTAYCISTNPFAYYQIEHPGSFSVNWGWATDTLDLNYNGTPANSDSLLYQCYSVKTFDGVNDFLRSQTDTINFISTVGDQYEISIATWIRPLRTPADKATNNEYEVILCKGYDTAIEWMLVLTDENKIAFQTNMFTGNVVESTTVLQENNRYHIGVTVSGDSASPYIELYINGELEDSYSLAFDAPDSTESPFTIGGILNSTKTAVVNNTTYLPFEGRIEGVALYNYTMAQAMYYQQYVLGLSGSYYFYNQTIDTAPLDIITNTAEYQDLLEEHGAKHYWKFNDVNVALGNQLVPDAIGSSDLRQRRTTQKDIGEALASDAPNTAVRIKDSDSYTFSTDAYSTNPASEGFTFGTRSPMSYEMWYKKPSGSSSHLDGMVGWLDHDEVISESYTSGMIIARKSGIMYFKFFIDGVAYQSTLNESLLYGDITSEDPNAWHHLVTTVDSQGVVRLYIDSDQVYSFQLQLPGNDGVQPPDDCELVLGGNPPYDTAPDWGINHVAIYNVALTRDQIISHYSVGRYGNNYDRAITGDYSGLSNITGYDVSCSETASLENEEDITQYIIDYTIDRDITQFVDVGSLQCKEEWGLKELNTKLKPNTYVIIKERYTDLNYTYDSGWVELGHFLVEGPLGYNLNSQGSIVYEVALKGILKMSTFGIADRNLNADKLRHERVKLVRTDTAANVFTFQVARPNTTPTEYYGNWAESPSIKAYYTNYTNLTKPDSLGGGTWNSSDIPDELRVKNADGAVEVVGGLGKLRIDQDYYEDNIPDGMGNPDPVTGLTITFERYITSEDIINTTISDIYVNNGRWSIALAGISSEELLPKTVFVKTGTAKGKIFMIQPRLSEGYDSYQGFYNFSAFTSVERTGGFAWTDTDKVEDYDDDYAECSIGALGESDFLLVGIPLTSVDIPEEAVLKGVEIEVLRPASLSSSNQYINDIYAQLTYDDELVGDNKAYDADMGQDSIVYGGPNDLWGLPLTSANIADYSFSFAVRNTRALTDTVMIDNIRVKYYFDNDVQTQLVIIKDAYGNIINPHYEGLAIGDQVQVGDANRPEDILRKVFASIGLQESDPTAPFYFVIESLPSEYKLSVPPLKYSIEDGVKWHDVLTEIFQFLPPNYILYVDRNGVTRVKEIIQKSEQDYTVSATDLSENSSDYGIYTQVIAVGEGGDYINLADSSLSAVRAVKYDNWANSASESSANGITYTISDMTTMNTKLLQLFDSSQKTPHPNVGGGNGWRAVDYGIIWQKAGNKVLASDMEDDDLFILDIGKNISANTAYEVDSLQFTHIQTYIQREGIAQTLSVYYMTEEDYVAEYGKLPPAIPSQNGGNKTANIDQPNGSYFPLANSRAWKVLVDEFECNNGQTSIESSDFETEKQTRVRFLKVQCNQAHTLLNEGSSNRSRINLTDFKVFTSRKIVATATLGVTGKYNRGTFKQLVGRLRLRPIILEKNYYLDTYDAAKQFAIDQLDELYREFAPKALTCYAPGMDITNTVKIIDPQTGEETMNLVRSINYTGSTSQTVINVVDYNEEI